MINSLDVCQGGIERDANNFIYLFCRGIVHSLVYLFIPPCLSVSQQLINRIDQFLEHKSSQYYMKGINCIRVFREEAMKVMLICENPFKLKI